jgi:ABC-2 type transport system ATP-binding protein
MRVVEDTCERVVILSRGRVVADDSIPNLLALFRTRAFRIHFQNGLSDEALTQLSAHFPTLHWLPQDRALEVELSPHQSLYELIDLLREAGTEPEGIHRVEPDLEEVFLRLVRSERKEP